MRYFLTFVLVITLSFIALSGCGNGGNDNGNGNITEPVSFSIEVTPTFVLAYPGESFQFYVTVLSDDTKNAVNISASIIGAALNISSEAIKPGETCTITITPSEAEVGKTLILKVAAERAGLTDNKTAQLSIGVAS